MRGALNDLYLAARPLLRTPLNLARNRIDPPVIVLIYHRVTRLASDPELLAVTPENFRSQMRHLKEHAALLRFEEDWGEARGDGRPAVCVTFDDGYADNALEALPILEELGVPATFFVSTGAIGNRCGFWWDELGSIILETPQLPASFTMTQGDPTSWPTGSAQQRQELYREMVRGMKGLDARRRGDRLLRLRQWAGCSAEGDLSRRAMSLEELRRLAANSWVTIGAHTVNHARLAALPRGEQLEEIVASKRQLEQWLGREIEVFSYPFGRRCDYNRDSVALCRQAGFTKAAANFGGQAHRWTDPFQVPRNLVRDWPERDFAQRFRSFLTA